MPCDVEDEGDIRVAETLTPTNIKGVSTQLKSDTALREYSAHRLSVEASFQPGRRGESVGASGKPVDGSSYGSHLEIRVIEGTALEGTTIIDAAVGLDPQDPSELAKIPRCIGT